MFLEALSAAKDLGRVNEIASFVKLGQILATRVDLFAEEWIAEFELLLDSAPPIEFDELRAQLEEDLGDAPEEVFAEFDR